MTEEKVRNRGWVKNAAIIFLSVLLVLTFFSNTILNRSLPEVAAQYAQPGSITTRIRGTGTVTANESYEVVLDQSREVESVYVRVGDQVQAGDVLFALADKDSEELKQAEKYLEDLNYQYQEAIINASQNDYARENRDIQLAREALEEAIAERDSKVVTEEEVKAAENNLKSIKDKVTALNAEIAVLQERVNKAQADLDALGGRNEGNDNSALRAAMLAAQAALNEAKHELDTAELRYQDDYNVLYDLAAQEKQNREADPDAPVYEHAAYMAALAAEYKDVHEVVPGTDGTEHIKADLAEAYYAIEDAEKKVEACQRSYQEAEQAYYNSVDGGNAYEYDRLAKKLRDAQDDLKEVQSELEQALARQEEAQAALADAENRMAEYKAAVSAVKQAQTALEDRIFQLQEQQKADNKAEDLQALQMSRLRGQIEEAQAEVDRLRSSSVDATVVSKVNGIVKSLGVSAGRNTEPGAVLATIEVPDRGYSVSITVTAEQAKRVSVGDRAEVTTGWWGGGDITATLRSIKPDPSAPTQNRILVFDVTGEVEDGTQLSLSIGQKSRNYDIIVPNSAIRSDANGNFVLIVLAKSSPLGNRYIATRVDVQVLASDDLNTAIAGGVTNGDFVITTSSRPLESGMQVRMAEG